MIHHLHREQLVAGDPARIWEFFATPQNLAAITPAHMRFETVGEVAPHMYPGQLIEYRIGVFPCITTRWLTEITHVREGSFFVDEQRFGPYKLWHHEHHFAPTSDGRGTRMTDHITYDVGWGPLGSALHALWIRRQLATIFDFRAQAITKLFPG
ncbi:MAG: SRPBCC family protein [Verrucomicrobiota bacterium]